MVDITTEERRLNGELARLQDVVDSAGALVHNRLIGAQHNCLLHRCGKMKRLMFTPDVNGRRHAAVGMMYSYSPASESSEGVRVWRRVRRHTSDLSTQTDAGPHSTENEENQKNG